MERIVCSPSGTKVYSSTTEKNPENLMEKFDTAGKPNEPKPHANSAILIAVLFLTFAFLAVFSLFFAAPHIKNFLKNKYRRTLPDSPDSI